jgi:hypothetical protein
MKVLAALLLAGTVFGAAYGAAATLGTGTSFLSAGNARVAGCETGAVTTAAHLRGSFVDGITVSGLDEACSGKSISVTLTGVDGTSSLFSLSGVVPQGGGDVSLTGSAPVAAAAVSGVSVAIEG